ncbi:MAG: hypothetical protein FLDDKLPJ_00279 [Phycisphaerae bacterium]|nr:hypothetical protein [Phycisphaerae bacterium]
MAAQDASDPVADDEIVLKHVTERSGWYDPARDPSLSWVAFRPNKDDVSGMSVWRAKYKTAEDVARLAARWSNRKDQKYYVLSLRVGDLRRIGIQVSFTHDEGKGETGHASLTTLNTATYDSEKNRIREMAERVCKELVLRVDGPFGSFEERDQDRFQSA